MTKLSLDVADANILQTGIVWAQAVNACGHTEHRVDRVDRVTVEAMRYMR